MPKLIVLTEGIEPASFELTKEVASVGRVDENDITLPHESVSGSHAELVLRGEDVHVRDVGSTNGTFINGNKVLAQNMMRARVAAQFATIGAMVVAAGGFAMPSKVQE